MKVSAPLAVRMRALADSGHPKAKELRELGLALAKASNAEPFSAQSLIGAWARAKKLWCECTGESLL